MFYLNEIIRLDWKISMNRLESKRLHLRPFELSDSKRVTELLADGKVNESTQNVPHPYTEDMATDWISRHKEWMEHNIKYPYAVILKDTEELIGVVSVSILNGVGELGYWYGVAYWNKGYGTEAASLLFEYAFNTLNLHKIYGRFLVTNPASGEIMKKLGMKKEGLQREHILKGDTYLDIELYGILKSEYSKQDL